MDPFFNSDLDKLLAAKLAITKTIKGNTKQLNNKKRKKNQEAVKFIRGILVPDNFHPSILHPQI